MTGTRFIAGVMTGTSLDGLDAALAAIDGRGLSMHARLVGAHSLPLRSVADTLLALARGEALTPIEILRAARQLGERYADAVAALVGQHLPCDATLHAVAAHGQTVWHAPDQHLSWQLLDPWPIVARLGVPVVYDLRQADLSADGQGAPITPLADWLLFRPARGVVNLGGICNLTLLPARDGGPEAIAAMDVGPCNLLLDGLVRRRVSGVRYDDGGRLAASGSVSDIVMLAIRDSQALRQAQGRSMGREDFHDRWLNELAALDVATPDLLASAVEVVARLIVERCGHLSAGDRMLLAGGGARNGALVARLRELAPCRVALLDDVGVPADAREALEMAVLGALCEDGVPITLPQVTGATAPGVAGVWAGLHRP